MHRITNAIHRAEWVGYSSRWFSPRLGRRRTSPNPASPVAQRAYMSSSNSEMVAIPSSFPRPTGCHRLRTFGPQRAGRSEGRFPDGSTSLAALSLPTPGTANAFTIVSPPTVDASGSTVRFTTTAGVRYTLQRSDDFVLWEDVAPPQVAAGTEMSVTDRNAGRKAALYRVQMSR
jgi:hypothetical protein